MPSTDPRLALCHELLGLIADQEQAISNGNYNDLYATIIKKSEIIKRLNQESEDSTSTNRRYDAAHTDIISQILDRERECIATIQSMIDNKQKELAATESSAQTVEAYSTNVAPGNSRIDIAQ